MIDFILLIFVAAVFAGGVWCGKTFLSFSAMLEQGKTQLREKLKGASKPD